MSTRDSLIAARPIAALFVTKGGTYFDLEGVDPWDEERDARLYAGPHPVVFGLPEPPESGWQRTFCGGWVTRVDQGVYGHRGRKPTWLYAMVDDPPALDWRHAPQGARWWVDTRRMEPLAAHERLRRENSSGTPPAFRDALLVIARTSRVTSEAAA